MLFCISIHTHIYLPPHRCIFSIHIDIFDFAITPSVIGNYKNSIAAAGRALGHPIFFLRVFRVRESKYSSSSSGAPGNRTVARATHTHAPSPTPRSGINIRASSGRQTFYPSPEAVSFPGEFNHLPWLCPSRQFLVRSRGEWRKIILGAVRLFVYLYSS